MSAVAGIEKFKEAMAGHEGEYVLIGGSACSILFDEVGDDFRLTKDLDVVVLTDGRDPSFGDAFWRFAKSVEYKAGKRKNGECAYYRFILPEDSPFVGKYPSEIELFAKHPDFELKNEDSWITPLPFDETVSSLSAIILNEGYYEFIKSNISSVGGVSVLLAAHIIPLKMRAHIDNKRLYEEGVGISEKTLRKHRADVARLIDLLAPNSRIALTGQMRDDAWVFLLDFEEYIARETNRKKRALLQEKLDFLRQVYL